MYRNTTDFCALILYPATVLNSCVGSSNLGWIPLGFLLRSMIKGMRLMQSKGQAKLYFAPSIKNQTDQSGLSLMKRQWGWSQQGHSQEGCSGRGCSADDATPWSDPLPRRGHSEQGHSQDEAAAWWGCSPDKAAPKKRPFWTRQGRSQRWRGNDDSDDDKEDNPDDTDSAPHDATPTRLPPRGGHRCEQGHSWLGVMRHFAARLLVARGRWHLRSADVLGPLVSRGCGHRDLCPLVSWDRWPLGTAGVQGLQASGPLTAGLLTSRGWRRRDRWPLDRWCLGLLEAWGRWRRGPRRLETANRRTSSSYKSCYSSSTLPTLPLPPTLGSPWLFLLLPRQLSCSPDILAHQIYAVGWAPSLHRLGLDLNSP